MWIKTISLMKRSFERTRMLGLKSRQRWRQGVYEFRVRSSIILRNNILEKRTGAILRNRMILPWYDTS